MRVVAQRVSRASVRIDGVVVGEVGNGLMLLVGFTHDDTSREVIWMTEKLLGLRIFSDDDGKMNRSVTDVGGSILVVSQFTLYGDARKGRRPSFVGAARPEIAIPLYREFLSTLASSGTRIAAGEFGADMKVDLVNDGPVTLVLEREATTAD
ncbi:MAG: D-aminoacyl-tRNA deacylase [Gemmatimonadaceae bacterium]